MSEYNKKIEEMLSKVSKGEPVFKQPEPPPAPPKVNPLHERMAKDGVKKTLEGIFTESFEVPSYITEQETDLKIDDSSFVFANVPSSFKDADEYWKSLTPYFLRLGHPKNNGASGYIDTELEKGKDLRIRLVRDENNNDKPSIAFGYVNGPTITPIEVSSLVSKLGLSIDRTESKSIGNWIIADVLGKA